MEKSLTLIQPKTGQFLKVTNEKISYIHYWPSTSSVINCFNECPLKAKRRKTTLCASRLNRTDSCCFLTNNKPKL